ncbi:MAG: hypothetical protein CFE24_09560 [Flavobacterium sp. BFFFF2]|nr:MAG: hypothetical protein CFE24_09560 [Flavobacterium sp. BFFFF2]
MSYKDFELSIQVSEPFPFNIESLKEIETNQWVKNQWPLVYFLKNEGESKAYIGESNNASLRLKNHLANPKKAELFQTVNIIGSDKFNKSATLDLESRLIQYINAEGTFTTENLNLGHQNHNYYQQDLYKNLFYTVWQKLIEKKIVSKSLADIENSELFKYSPYKSLNVDQYKSVLEILTNINNSQGNSIFVSGSAGTGKTILATYLMKLLVSDVNSIEDTDVKEDDIYEITLIKEFQKKYPKAKIGFVIAMTPLRETIKKVFSNVPGLKKQMVMSPSETFKLGIKYDLLIVDEAHRLRQYRNISWRGEFKKKNEFLGLGDDGTELDWIMANSRNQLFFYDAAQSVKPSDIDEFKFTDLITKPDTLKLSLKSQMRTKGGNDYITFIDKLLNCDVNKKPAFSEDFELEYFDSFQSLYNKLKIKEKENGLCRMIAGYSWEWKSDPKRKENLDLNAIDIIIDGMEFQWNKTYNDWITSKNSFEQIGCIHTTQGYDLNYAAIIFGLEIDYDPIQNEIVVDKTKYFDKYGKNGITDIKDLKSYIVNIYRTVLYRGIKGVYIYACNNSLKQYLRKHLNISQDINLINDASGNKPRIIPFESVKPFVNAVPIYDIKVAASNFTDPQFYEEFSWAELPMQVSPKKGYFIAQVIGESMNKKIPNGSYCLFEEYTAGSRNGEIVLVECTSIQDGNYGAGYTIKEYKSIKSITEDSFRHNSIVLKPLSDDDTFEDIVLSEDELIKFTVRGIFKKVLIWA